MNDEDVNLKEDIEKTMYDICVNYLEEYIILLGNLHEPSIHEIDVIIVNSYGTL